MARRTTNAAALLAMPMVMLFAASISGASEGTQDAEREYRAQCASCHGQDLKGGPFGTPLIGTGIAQRWPTREALANHISQTMPPTNPGGLSDETYGMLADYILSASGVSVAAAPDGKGDASGSVKPVSEHDAAASGGVGAAVQNEDQIYQATIARRADVLANLSPVTESDLRNPPAGDWLHWRRTDDGHGFSPLDQINRDNVGMLTVAWAKALPAGSNAITPLVHDGVMFLNSSGNTLAIDLATGDTLWRHTYKAKMEQAGPPVTQPKSIAMFEDKIYVSTLDNHIIALDMRSGEEVWDSIIQQTDGMLRTSTGPIVVRGKLIQGTTGCFNNVPEPRGCFIAALDARTGKEVWRFYTIPTGDEPGAASWGGAPGDRRIGGGIWTAGTYDSVNNLILFGVGQTYHIAPLMQSGKASRENAGLYTDSTVALDPDTGKLVWHYQHMARDVWDMDWPFERTVMDLKIEGKTKRVVANIGKLGILDAVDAKTGKYLFSYDMGMQNLITAIDPETGFKTTDPALDPDPEKPVFICPFAIGVRNWPATSYNPETGRMFVTGGDSCMEFTWEKGREGLDILYSPRPRPGSDGNYGRFVAIDVAVRKEAWNNGFRAPLISAALSTAGGIVFGGGRDRRFRALDSKTGKELWQMHLDNVPAAAPVTFTRDGKQYVAITTGGGHANDVTRASQTPEIELAAAGTTLWVFALPDE